MNTRKKPSPKSKAVFSAVGLLALSATALNPDALATPIEDSAAIGSSVGVVCRDEQGRISSVRLLDLYLNESFRGGPVPRSTRPAASQQADALKSLAPTLAYDVREALGKIAVEKLPAGERLRQRVDLSGALSSIEDGCSPEWVTFHVAKDQLKIVSRYFDLMSPTDQAATILHEALFKLALDRSGDSDSRWTRKIVAELFSSQPSKSYLNAMTEDLKLKRIPFYGKGWGEKPVTAIEAPKASTEFALQLSVTNFELNSFESAYAFELKCWDGVDEDAMLLEADRTGSIALAPRETKTIQLRVPRPCRLLTLEGIADSKMQGQFSYRLSSGGIILGQESKIDSRRWTVIPVIGRDARLFAVYPERGSE